MMISNEEWLAFFHNTKNKQHLFSLFVTYVCGDDFVQLSTLTILVNNEDETFNISIVSQRFLTAYVVVCSTKDTDIVVLMVFAYALNEINEKWLMKIETNKFINIRKIVE